MTKEQHYTLPVEVIVEMMRGLPDVISLHAHLLSAPGILKEPGHAEIVVGQGVLHSCTILTQVGHPILHQEEAFRVLQRCGDLTWTMFTALSQERSSAQEEPSYRRSEAQSVAPRRIRALTSSEMQTLPHMHRKVFALVSRDGTNRMERIAQLLQKSLSEVYPILLDLKQQQLIDL